MPPRRIEQPLLPRAAVGRLRPALRGHGRATDWARRMAAQTIAELAEVLEEVKRETAVVSARNGAAAQPCCCAGSGKSRAKPRRSCRTCGCGSSGLRV